MHTVGSKSILMNTIHIPKLFKSATALLLAAVLAPAASAAPKKVLVVTVTEGFAHSSIPLAEKILTDLGKKSEAYEVVGIVNSGPKPRAGADLEAWTSKVTSALAEKMSESALKNYDAVIFASTTGNLPLPDKKAFLDWIKAGHGFVGIHAGSDTFHGPNNTVDPYIEMLGGEFKIHGAQVGVECMVQDTKHPATRHLGKSFVVNVEEVYQFKNYDPTTVHELLTLDKHPNDKTPGHYAVAWCKNYGEGRVFYTSLGHREDIWDPEWTDGKGKRANPTGVAEAYQKHLLGGIKWAVGLEPGDATPQAKK